MATTFIKGDAIVLYIWDGTIYRPIACLTSNSLSRTRNIIEAQTKCNPGQMIRQGGSESYELPFDGLYIDTTSVGAEVTKASHDYLMTVFDGNTPTDWKMDTGLTDTGAYYGTAILGDLNLDNPAGDEFSNFSGALSGSGLITTTDPHAV
jgi:predicted secreted protein